MMRSIYVVLITLFLLPWPLWVIAEAPGAVTPPTTTLSPLAGVLLALSSVSVFLASKVWEYFTTKKRNDAQSNLGLSIDVTAKATLDRQEARIKTLESRIEALESRLNDEQDLRRDYQDRYSTLRMRVAQLEQILRDHNIEVPKVSPANSDPVALPTVDPSQKNPGG